MLHEGEATTIDGSHTESTYHLQLRAGNWVPKPPVLPKDWKGVEYDYATEVCAAYSEWLRAVAC
jgi:hypothetical protein